MIDTSPKLLRSMCRLDLVKLTSEITERDMSFPPYRIRGLCLGIRQAHGKPVVHVEMTEGQYASRYRKLRKSLLFRSMLIAQPSPKMAMLYRDCKCVSGDRQTSGLAIHSDIGVTYGHMVSTMDSMGRCPDCNRSCLWRMEGRYTK